MSTANWISDVFLFITRARVVQLITTVVSIFTQTSRFDSSDFNWFEISAEKYSEQDIATCSQAPDSGPCIAAFKRFYYDVRDGRCHSFVFGGCGGNQNNFRTLEDCQQSCGKFSPDSNETADHKSQSNSTDGHNYCIVNEEKYLIGSKLDIGRKCVDCECRIPPDFTCIQKSCPSPPPDCRVSYSQDSCCPLIDCNYNKSE